jgi:lipopolysaccharide transport system permease protein
MALVKEKCRIMPGSFNTLAYIETTRYMLLNVGHISLWGLGYTFGVTVVLLLVGY